MLNHVKQKFTVVVHITLSNGGEAVVDAADAEKCAGRSWFSVRRGARVYAASSHDGKQILLHRWLLGLHDGRQLVDHANGDGLDNRRSNLRLATAQQNSANRKKFKGQHSSKYKGVSYLSDIRKWMARIRVNGTLYYLGTFKSQRRAAITYNRVARRAFGKFACLNEVSHV